MSCYFVRQLTTSHIRLAFDATRRSTCKTTGKKHLPELRQVHPDVLAAAAAGSTAAAGSFMVYAGTDPLGGSRGGFRGLSPPPPPVGWLQLLLCYFF